jgi:hypothetical protein
MKNVFSEPLPPELQAELDALAAMPDDEIGTADMPPITDWSHAIRGPQPSRQTARKSPASDL